MIGHGGLLRAFVLYPKAVVDPGTKITIPPVLLILFCVMSTLGHFFISSAP